MAKFRRCHRALALILLVASTGWGLAQQPADITLVGSAIGNALIERLAEAGGATSLAITTSGTAAGIDQFCDGETDFATATREMTGAERAICDANEVVYSELLIGHHVAAFVTGADSEIECLDETQVREALKPSSSNVLTDWSFAREALAELPLTLLLPGDDKIAYYIADALVAGDGLRLDAETLANGVDAAGRVNESEGALALVAASDVKASAESVTILQIASADTGDCIAPSAEDVEGGDYDFALSLYVVVNRARLNASEGLAEFIQFIMSEAGAAVMRGAGVTPPTAATSELNTLILSGQDAAIGAGAGDYQIPPDLSGEVRLVGAANAYQALSRVGEQLTESYQFFSYTFEATGSRAGIKRLCDGEADIALLDAALAVDALEACAANDLVTKPLALGAQATVLVSNAGDEFSACLTAEQVNAIWSGDAENWSAIDAAFPDQQMTLFGPSFTDQYTDILLQTADGIIPPVRRDTEMNFDPLYRAAAVGNVVGALTYMSWPEYQRVIDNEQANIQLVSINEGAGCVEANVGSIENSTYPLSRRASMLISEESLAKAQAQSFLWRLTDDDNWALLERNGFVGASTLDLPIIRRNFSSWFAEAEALYQQAGGAAVAGNESSEDSSE